MNLKEFIDSEPPNAGRTDQQVLDWTLEPVPVVGVLDRNKLIAWCRETNAIKRLEDRKTDLNGDIQSAAYAALEVLRSESVDLSDSDAGATLTALGGIFTADEIASLKAKATTNVPRHQTVGLPRYKIQHIAHARAS